LNYQAGETLLLQDQYTFAIGGKGKDLKQINDVENSYVAADESF